MIWNLKFDVSYRNDLDQPTGPRSKLNHVPNPGSQDLIHLAICIISGKWSGHSATLIINWIIPAVQGIIRLRQSGGITIRLGVEISNDLQGIDPLKKFELIALQSVHATISYFVRMNKRTHLVYHYFDGHRLCRAVSYCKCIGSDWTLQETENNLDREKSIACYAMMMSKTITFRCLLWIYSTIEGLTKVTELKK